MLSSGLYRCRSQSDFIDLCELQGYTLPPVDLHVLVAIINNQITLVLQQSRGALPTSCCVWVRDLKVNFVDSFLSLQKLHTHNEFISGVATCDTGVYEQTLERSTCKI